MSYTHHCERVVEVPAMALDLFNHLDDVRQLGRHMTKPSAMMMGGRMTYELDAAGGRAVGSVIRMRGVLLGIEMLVDEIVIQYEPPRLKVWETRAPTRLLIMGGYRMGFEIEENKEKSRLRIFLDYSLGRGVAGRIVGSLLARPYARWCVDRMAREAMSG